MRLWRHVRQGRISTDNLGEKRYLGQQPVRTVLVSTEAEALCTQAPLSIACTSNHACMCLYGSQCVCVCMCVCVSLGTTHHSEGKRKTAVKSHVASRAERHAAAVVTQQTPQTPPNTSVIVTPRTCSDASMKQFVLDLQAKRKVATCPDFIIRDLGDSGLLVKKDSVTEIQRHIDEMLDAIAYKDDNEDVD
jgi:hypothetical protein